MQETSAARPVRLADTGALLIVILLVVDSLHFVFARMLLPLMPPAVSALYIMAVGTVEVAVFGLFRKRIHLATLMRQRWFFLAIGFLVAVSTILNYVAVEFIDPGTASLLGKTSLLFGLGIGMVWLRERLTRTQAGGALLALAGVGVITFQPGDYLSRGALMVLASAFLYAIHAALTKRYGSEIDFVDFFFFRLLCTTGFMLLLVAGSQPLVWPTPPVLALLILVGTVDVVISRTIYYAVLRRMSVSLLSIVLTLSPVAAAAWSLVLFGVWPTSQQLLGGAAVLLGVGVVAVAQAANIEDRR